MLIKTLGKKNGKTTFIKKVKPRILRPWGAQDHWWKGSVTYGYSSARTNRYQAGRDADLERIKQRSNTTLGDLKFKAHPIRWVTPGTWVRRVDGHGKSYGKRFEVLPEHKDDTYPVRRCRPEPESETSYYSRMRNKLHRLEKRL